MKRHGKIMIRAVSAAFSLLLIITNLTAQAALKDAQELVPLGSAAGISLSTEGVLVVGLSGVKAGDETIYPARDAGVKEGDLILSVDGTPIHTAQELQVCMDAAGESVILEIKRGEETLRIPVNPVRTEDGPVRIGIWIRENMLGIGTLTFYDPATGIYGALGHGINEKNSGALLKIEGGDLLHSVIEGVKPGEVGKPGELQGSYEPEEKIGSVEANTNAGVFGMLDTPVEAEALPIAHPGEISLGDAKILSCIEGEQPREYSIRITAIYCNDDAGRRDMMIEVTDKRLISVTGGIVQGMSGSPIIQSGKIVGAVTHVLVNNPQKGYGIFIDNMLTAFESSENTTSPGNYVAA